MSPSSLGETPDADLDKSATALFTFPYSDDFSGIEIRHFNFERPVLDFIIGDDDVIVVSLDGQWTSAEADDSENSLMVRTVKNSSGEVCMS
jgi:tRNA (guanine-N(7)-)-methyltransferase subunit TRM82